MAFKGKPLQIRFAKRQRKINNILASIELNNQGRLVPMYTASTQILPRDNFLHLYSLLFLDQSRVKYINGVNFVNTRAGYRRMFHYR